MGAGNRELDDLVSSLKSLRTSISVQSKSTLTKEEAADYLGLTVKSLLDLTHKKLIPYYKPNGKMIYFDKEELDEWIRRNRQTPVYERKSRP